MKKIMICALAVSLLAGCAPRYTKMNPAEMTDLQLCGSMGFAVAGSDAERARELVKEGEYRSQMGKATINAAQCEQEARLGAMEYSQMKQREQNFSNAMADLDRQQQEQQAALNAQRPVNTTCNSFGNSVNCTTW